MMKKSTSWHQLSDDQLLELRLCDLGLRLEGSEIEKCAQKLYRELEDRGLDFRPHFWISDEWFSPDGIPGIAVPFYLLHPRLVALEKKMIGEAEGANPDWCMKLVRHECGHAIDNAFKLRQIRPRQQLFGATSKAYPSRYEVRPYSKKFVQHLDSNYAQAHPDEDWAETFAVWLTPKSNWKKRYKGWQALEKLEMVDHIMASLIGQRPLVKNREKVCPIEENRMTLRSYFKRKRKRLGLDRREQFLNRFERILEPGQAPKASQFLALNQKKISRQVAKETDQYQYRIEKMMKEVMAHCRKKDLRLKPSSRIQFKNLLAREAKRYVKDGEHRISM